MPQRYARYCKTLEEWLSKVGDYFQQPQYGWWRQLPSLRCHPPQVLPVLLLLPIMSLLDMPRPLG
jgi:hypothetical protein